MSADLNMGVALARRCTTEALLQVLAERADADGDTDATAEELAEVERARASMAEDTFAEPARSHARLSELGVTLLPRVVRELVARRIVNRESAGAPTRMPAAERARQAWFAQAEMAVTTGEEGN